MARARQQGAKFATGGGRPAEHNRGWFVEPSVLTGVTPDMEILNEEPFGPVAPICKVSSFDEAITLANRSRFGLGANLYSLDMTEAFRAVREIESGILWINAPLLDNDALAIRWAQTVGQRTPARPRGSGSIPEHQVRHDRSPGVQPGLLVVPIRRTRNNTNHT